MEATKYYLYILMCCSAIPIFWKVSRGGYAKGFLLPYIAFCSIYIFNIVGSIWFIDDPDLFSAPLVLSFAVVILTFYIFFIFISLLEKQLCINWKNIKTGPEHIFPAVYVGIMLLVSTLCFIVYYNKYGLPPLITANFTETADLYGLREEKVTSIGGDITSVYWGFRLLPSYCFIYLYTLKIIYNTRFYRTLFFLFTPFILILMYSFLNKGEIVYLLLSMFFVNIFLGKDKGAIKRLTAYVFVGFFSIVAMIRLYLMDRNMVEFISVIPKFLFWRICAGYSWSHANVLKIFPDEHEFFHGTAFSNPGHLLPYDPVNLPQFLGEWIHGIVENMSVPSYSEGFANFGWIGLFVILAIMFIQMIVIQMAFKKLPHTALTLSFYTLFNVNMLKYAIGPIIGVISLEEVFLMAFLLVLSAILEGAVIGHKKNFSSVELYSKQTQ